MLISDLSSYVCSSDLADARLGGGLLRPRHPWPQVLEALVDGRHRSPRPLGADPHQRHAVGEIDPLGWCVGVGGILFGHRQMLAGREAAGEPIAGATYAAPMADMTLDRKSTRLNSSH